MLELSNIYLAFLILIIAFVLLFYSTEKFVAASIGISNYFKIPRIITGIIIVSLATTSPEFAVSVQSSFLKHSQLALGNAIGSIICDNGLALALIAIVSLSPLIINKKYFQKVFLFTCSMCFLTFLFSLDKEISRVEGLILLIALLFYFIILIKNKTSLPFVYKEESKIFPHIIKFLLSVVCVIFFSHYIVKSAIFISNFFMISESVIGLTIVAIGTSLPEIATAIVSAKNNEGELSIGNILGADVLNILWITGTSALVYPIQIASNEIIYYFICLFVILALTYFFVITNLNRKKGFILLIVYFIYLFFTTKI